MLQDLSIPKEVVEFIKDLFPSVSNFWDVLLLFTGFFSVVFFCVFFIRAVFALISLIARKRIAKYIENLDLISDITNLKNVNDSSKFDLIDLVIKCVSYGDKIDRHTARKYNSRNVSSIIYKFCCARKIDKIKAIQYACCAYVYDAGFLEVDPDFFLSEVLTKEELDVLKYHVMTFFDKFSFIPKEIEGEFTGAALYHHENYDGTGYPEGLKGEEIPEIAQMIRVAESYVSLTSPRSYHRKLNHSQAMEVLKKSSSCYSPFYLELLDNIKLD